MKKLYLILFACTLGCFSCTENETPIKQEQAMVGNDPLLLSLSEFNDSILAVKPMTRMSIGRIFAIAADDIMGAFEVGGVCAGIGCMFGPKGAIVGGGIGAVVGGVGGSYKCYCETKGQEMVPLDSIVAVYFEMKKDENTMYVPDSISSKLDIPLSYQCALNVGLTHNEMLDILRNDKIYYGIDSDNELFPDNNDIGAIPISGSGLSDEEMIEKMVLNSSDFIDAYNEMLEKLEPMDVIPYAGNNEGLDMEVMRLFIDVCADYVETSNDAYFIINKYIERIENHSSLTTEQKRHVYYGLAVAAYSTTYWEENL